MSFLPVPLHLSNRVRSLPLAKFGRKFLRLLSSFVPQLICFKLFNSQSGRVRHKRWFSNGVTKEKNSNFSVNRVVEKMRLWNVRNEAALGFRCEALEKIEKICSIWLLLIIPSLVPIHHGLVCSCRLFVRFQSVNFPLHSADQFRNELIFDISDFCSVALWKIFFNQL